MHNWFFRLPSTFNIQRKIMMPWNGTTEHPRDGNSYSVFWAGIKYIHFLSNINPDERKLCTSFKFRLCNAVYNFVLETLQWTLSVYLSCLCHIFPFHMAASRHFCKTKTKQRENRKKEITTFNMFWWDF